MTSMICPTCLQEIDPRVVEVSSGTVVDSFDIWLENHDRTQLTERIPILCVQRGTAPPKEPITEPEAGQP